MTTKLTKKCPQCNQTLSAEKFGISRKRADGLGAYCLDCHKSYSCKNYHKNKYNNPKKSKNPNLPPIWDEIHNRIDNYIKEHVDYSDLLIAKNLVIPYNNVRKRRLVLESEGMIQVVTKVIDLKGNWRRRNLKNTRYKLLGQHHIYFIQEDAGKGPIKIGESKNIEQRIRAIQTQVPHEINVLAIIPNGNSEKEKKLHDRFNAHRIVGEWFAACDEIYSIIEKVKKQYPQDSVKMLNESLRECRSRKGIKNKPIKN